MDTKKDSEEKPMFKKLKKLTKETSGMSDSTLMEIEAVSKENTMDSDFELKFIPRPPPPREKFNSPIGRNHVKGTRVFQFSQKGFN